MDKHKQGGGLDLFVCPACLTTWETFPEAERCYREHAGGDLPEKRRAAIAKLGGAS